MVGATQLLRLARAPASTSALRSALRARAGASCCFSSATNGNSGDNDDDKDVRRPNGLHALNDMNDTDGMNPFERLLQHSQQFREHMSDAEKYELDADDMDAAAAAATVAVEQDDDEQTLVDDDTDNGDRVASVSDSDSDSDDSDSDDSDSDDSDSDDSDSDDDDDDDARAMDNRFSQRSDRFRPRNDDRSARRAAHAARSVRRRLLDAPDDALDYEHELSNLSAARAKERKYQQLLHREADKDRVCRNCGERGHVAKHCLLPMICSNCGGLGHKMRDCVFPDYVSSNAVVEDSVTTRQRDRQQRAQERAIDKQRMGKRFETFKHEFDAQLDEYIAQSEAAAAKRRQRKAERLAQQQEKQEKQEKEGDDTFKPVIG